MAMTRELLTQFSMDCHIAVQLRSIARYQGGAYARYMDHSRRIEQTGAAALPPRLVLYDGVCGFCTRAVQRLLTADPDGRLHFAPLQGTTAAALRERHPEIPDDIDTIVYIETADKDEYVSLRSEAIFRIYEALEVKSRLTSWLRLLPRSWTDIGYRLFGHVRYRLFGKLDACSIPSPEQRDRFLP
jgi:predicted DCC family thiol-disulfide oxidoreductase YuxK